LGSIDSGSNPGSPTIDACVAEKQIDYFQ
jgi:hypothetical protein